MLNTAESASGRAGEAAWCSLNALRWDPHFTCVVEEIVQMKTNKIKLIPFVAGQHRHRCWFLQLGDYLALNTLPVYDESKASSKGEIPHPAHPTFPTANIPIIFIPPVKTWLFPELKERGRPNEAIGYFIKAFHPTQGRAPCAGGHFCFGADTCQVLSLTRVRYNKNLTSVALAKVPERATAGGMRPGCVNFLATKMPIDFVPHLTGHDLEKLGALFNYLDAHLAISVTGAQCLAGWPAPPRGELSEGPRAPTLAALVTTDAARLSTMADNLFRIDSATPPALRAGGHLRPMIEAALASMLMHYSARVKAGEMTSVLSKMATACAAPHFNLDLARTPGHTSTTLHSAQVRGR